MVKLGMLKYRVVNNQVHEDCKVKRTWRLVVLALLVFVATVAGCQPTSTEPEREIRRAPIHEVQVNISESYTLAKGKQLTGPPQVFVYIKGGLADGCTIFHESTIKRRQMSTISITVTTRRPRDAVCTQVYGFFEQNIVLGANFTSGETYTINVNDKTTSFVMQ